MNRSELCNILKSAGIASLRCFGIICVSVIVLHAIKTDLDLESVFQTIAFAALFSAIMFIILATFKFFK